MSKRKFDDDNNDEENGTTSSNSNSKESELSTYGKYNLNHYFFQEIDEKISSNRFRIALYRKGLRLRNIEDAPGTPDQLLEKLIEYMIADARSNKFKETKSLAEKFSMIIRSSLLEKPIQVICYFYLLAYYNK